jgi:hypothetical protein
MLVGIRDSTAALVAGIVLVFLRAAAIVMHFKIRDPLLKAVQYP